MWWAGYNHCQRSYDTGTDCKDEKIGTDAKNEKSTVDIESKDEKADTDSQDERRAAGADSKYGKANIDSKGENKAAGTDSRDEKISTRLRRLKGQASILKHISLCWRTVSQSDGRQGGSQATNRTDGRSFATLLYLTVPHCCT